MRKLLTILLLWSVAYGQTPAMTEHLIGPLPAYRGQHANYKIPFLFYLPQQLRNYTPQNVPPGVKKCVLVVDCHGIGERNNFSTMSAVTTSQLGDLYVNGMPQYLRYTTSQYVGKKYAAPGRTDSVEFAYLFFQVWGGDSRVWPTYWYNTLRWAINNWGHVIDTTRIYITGLSFGGGGVWSALQDSNVLKMVAGAIAVAPGYISTSGFTPLYNFQLLKEWPGFIYAIHSINDSTTDSHSCPTPPCTGGGFPGSWFTDRAIDSVLKYKGKTQLIYRRRTTGGHNTWDGIWNPVNSVNIYPLSNGNTYSHNIPWQSLLLRYTNTGRKKN